MYSLVVLVGMLHLCFGKDTNDTLVVVSETGESIFTESNLAIGLIILAVLYFILTAFVLFSEQKEQRYENDDDYVNADTKKKVDISFEQTWNDEENPIKDNRRSSIEGVKLTVPVERVSPAHQYCKGRYIYELNQLTTVMETDDSNQDEIRETINTENSIKPNKTKNSNRRKTVPCLKITP